MHRISKDHLSLQHINRPDTNVPPETFRNSEEYDLNNHELDQVQLADTARANKKFRKKIL